ncbi:MAG: hypothetical protein HY940_02730 [Gammaproteobacteria bacterium]|nr:hypothetical protein [Gammaproteobacteria bacterium]
MRKLLCELCQRLAVALCIGLGLCSTLRAQTVTEYTPGNRMGRAPTGLCVDAWKNVHACFATSFTMNNNPPEVSLRNLATQDLSEEASIFHYSQPCHSLESKKAPQNLRDMMSDLSVMKLAIDDHTRMKIQLDANRDLGIHVAKVSLSYATCW